MAPASPPDRRAQRRRVALAALGLLLFCGFVALGTWQLQRRAWKLALIERVEQRVYAEPVALPPPAQWGGIRAATHEYQPVLVEGRWRTEATVLAQALTEQGSGFWVMTPLQRADGTQVWINRGFVSADQRQRWLGERAAGTGAALSQVQGLLRLSEPGGGFLRRNDPAQQRWYSRDVPAMSRQWGLPQAAPFFIDAGLPGRTPPTGEGPIPGMTVIRFANNHLVYALTWYGLALMVVGAGWTVSRYAARRAPAAHSQPSPAHECPER